MIDETLEKIDRELERVENEYPIFYVPEIKSVIKSTDQTVIQDADPSGVKMAQYEDWEEFDTREGGYGSLEMRTSSAHGLNLARHVGLPENEVFEEGLRVVEMKRSLSEHFDHFTENRGRMPVYVPGEVKDFMDIRLGDSDLRESDEPYPAMLFYGNGESMPVFVNDFQSLLETVRSEEYRDFHTERENWKHHTGYEEFVDVLEDSVEEERTSFFAVPHLYEETDRGTYFPPVEDMVLVNEVDHVFTEEYDSSHLDTTGNAPAYTKKI
jgi:hypothetical protein